MGKLIELTGKKFGRWTVVSEAGRGKRRAVTWLCRCECGTQKVISGNNLRSGNTKSCGCLSQELSSRRNRTHGMYGTPVYKVWIRMRNRCNNPNNTAYKDYGGRGIKVCTRWDSFETFYADMGERPKGLTIERIDNNGSYEPTNCKWATTTEQHRNTRTNRMIKYGGESKCVSAWAEELGIKYSILYGRLNRYPPQIAFNM